MTEITFGGTIRTLLLAGVTFATGSAWNSAFQHYFNEHPQFKDSGPWMYALCMTFFAIIISYTVQTATNEIEKIEKKNN